MSQATPTIGANQSGLDYRTQDNDGKTALMNHHKGSTAPSYAAAGIIWLDDAATPWLLKCYDGTDWITIGAVNATTNTFTPYYGTAAPRMLNQATDTGSANAYAIAPSPAITAYVTGQIFTLKPANVNTGSSTLAVNGLSTITLKTPDGNNLPARCLLTTQTYFIYYDGTNGIVLNPPTNLQGTDVASASTLNLDTATGNYVHVTGTTTITAITLAQGKECTTVFDGALTLTNGASLLNISAANITTVAGDVAVWRGEASGVVRMVSYERKDGTSIGAAGTATNAQALTGTSTTLLVSPANLKHVLSRNPSRRYTQTNDLTTLDGITTTVSGTGAQVSSTSSNNTLPGLYSLERGTTTTGRSALYIAGGSTITLSETLEFTGIVTMKSGGTASDGTNNFTTRYGFMDGFTGEPTNGIYFRYNHATNSGNFQCVCREGGTETTINTSVGGHNGVAHELMFVGNGAGYEFFIDGVSQGSITTNVPATYGAMGASLVGSAGTSNRLTNIDMLHANLEFNTARY